MKLYELSADFIRAMEELNAMAEKGEISQDIADDTLEGLAMEWDDKVLATAKYKLSLEAEAAALKEAEKRMADRRKVIETKVESLGNYLLGQVVAVGRCPADAEVKISLRKSESVVIDDESAIPIELKRHIPESWQPDKAAIKERLKAGKQPWAHIETRQNLAIK